MKCVTRGVWGAVLVFLGVAAQVAFAQCTPQWQSMGSYPGVGYNPHSLTTWDPDGAGPLPAQLVAGGEFTTAGGVTVNRIALWDGSAWQSLGTGMNGYVASLTTWDPDGAGPLPAQLVAGGAFTTAGGVTVNRIARWDGSAWRTLGLGLDGAVYALACDAGGDLLVGGTFAIVDGAIASSSLARWHCICPADLDDGSGAGYPNGAVTIDDLLFFLAAYEAGIAAADLDDGGGLGHPDGAVTIGDLLFFLAHYEGGC